MESTVEVEGSSGPSSKVSATTRRLVEPVQYVLPKALDQGAKVSYPNRTVSTASENATRPALAAGNHPEPRGVSSRMSGNACQSGRCSALKQRKLDAKMKQLGRSERFH